MANSTDADRPAAAAPGADPATSPNSTAAAATTATAATAARDPDEWVTGDEPMTGPQGSYLSTLAHEAGEDLPTEGLTKAEASKRIDELQERTGRGQPAGS